MFKNYPRSKMYEAKRRKKVNLIAWKLKKNLMKLQNKKSVGENVGSIQQRSISIQNQKKYKKRKRKTNQQIKNGQKIGTEHFQKRKYI